MSTIAERLVEARKLARYPSARAAALAMGAVYDTYAQHENNTQGRGVPREAAIRYAKFFRVSLEWLLTGKGEARPNKGREAVLVGKVGAGAEVIRFEEGTVLAGIEMPAGVDAPNVAEISGESQYPLQEGWLIFYGPEHQGVAEELIGKLCVVEVKDGPTLLKTLKRGSRKGLFRLESWNAPPREDLKLVWAARVVDIRPR